MQIQSWIPETDGVFSASALVNKLEKSGYTCTTYTYPPGTVFPEHVHSVDKIDAVIQGIFCISIGKENYQLHPGDCIFVAAGTAHSAEVIGNQSVVAIDAVKNT